MSHRDLEVALRTLAATTDSSKPLPDADLVWQRAAACARWQQCELATESIRVAERAACIVCAVTGVVALLALSPGIAALLSGMDQRLVLLGGMALAATAAVALVLVKTLLAEE
jgi:hypothetical protein